MSEERPFMLDLEGALASDDGRSRRDELLARITAEARDVKAQLDRGMSPKEAAASQRLLRALFGAHQVVRAVWSFHHAR
jgi:hypothetical protein